MNKIWRQTSDSAKEVIYKENDFDFSEIPASPSHTIFIITYLNMEHDINCYPWKMCNEYTNFLAAALI